MIQDDGCDGLEVSWPGHISLAGSVWPGSISLAGLNQSWLDQSILARPLNNVDQSNGTKLIWSILANLVDPGQTWSILAW